MSPVTALCVAGLLAALLVRASVSHNEFAMTEAFTAFAVGIIMALGISLIPFWIARRSNKVLNTSMCVLTCMGIVSAGMRAWEDTNIVENKSTVANVDRQMDVLKDKAKRQLETGGVADVTTEDLAKAAVSMRKASMKLDGDEAAAMRSSSRLMSEFAQRNQEFKAVIDRFTELGGLDPGTIKSQEDIQQRLGLAQQFLALNESFAQHVKNTPRRFRELLMKEGVDERKLARAESEFSNGFKLRLQIKLREVEKRFGESAGDYLAILNEEWGQWKVDLTSGQVVFQDDAAIPRFNRASESLQAAMKAELEIQREILDMQVIAEVAEGAKDE
ncbi:MAG: hypothetical protein H7210_13220 [Pyrinomonadaceae bacterium]|nr:hypothetical protein [Phycisphaerales bacterium]